MPKLKQRLFHLFHGFVLVYAGILIVMSTLAYAQSWRPVDDVDRRLTKLEDINIDSRLAVIESTLGDIKSKVEKGLLDYVESGGVGLILMRFVYAALTKKGRISDADI